MTPSVLKHSATIERNQALGTNGRRQYGTLHSGVRCLLLPLSGESAQHNEMQPGRAFEIYFQDGTDVLVADKITIAGVPYIAKGIKPFTGMGNVAHIRILAETEHANGL